MRWLQQNGLRDISKRSFPPYEKYTVTINLHYGSTYCTKFSGFYAPARYGYFHIFKKQQLLNLLEANLKLYKGYNNIKKIFIKKVKVRMDNVNQYVRFLCPFKSNDPNTDYGTYTLDVHNHINYKTPIYGTNIDPTKAPSATISGGAYYRSVDNWKNPICEFRVCGDSNDLFKHLKYNGVKSAAPTISGSLDSTFVYKVTDGGNKWIKYSYIINYLGTYNIWSGSFNVNTHVYFYNKDLVYSYKHGKKRLKTDFEYIYDQHYNYTFYPLIFIEKRKSPTAGAKIPDALFIKAYSADNEIELNDDEEIWVGNSFVYLPNIKEFRTPSNFSYHSETDSSLILEFEYGLTFNI